VKILYSKAFAKDLEAVSRNPGVKKKLLKLIEIVKTINSINEIQNSKKIEGYDRYYRVRLGDYRLGLKLSGNTIEFVRILHRREIYRRFP
jgi:mRNA interferase RelE/StbE